MSDVVDQLRHWQEQIKALPEPLAYLVLDHSWDPRFPHVVGRDVRGKKYALVSPAVLDECRHVKASVVDSLGAFGVPLYRREDMPVGWPDA